MSRYFLYKSILPLCLVFLCFAYFPPTFAANYKAFQFNGKQVVTLNGRIESGESARFYHFIHQHRDAEFVLLQSHGGSIKEAIKIGKIIKQSGLKTAVETYCYSACFIALMSGNPRFVYQESYVGVHRPFVEKKEVVVEDDKQSPTYKNLGQYFNFLFGDKARSQKVVNLIYKTSSDQMHRVSRSESYLQLHYYSHPRL